MAVGRVARRPEEGRDIVPRDVEGGISLLIDLNDLRWASLV
jgi:hypothetical protein